MANYEEGSYRLHASSVILHDRDVIILHQLLIYVN